MSRALKERAQTSISKDKENFLAICMIAGFIGDDTIKLMKKDMGDVKVRRTIIYLLAQEEYITKLGSHYTYEYAITEKGIDYLECKCPQKYNCAFYRGKTQDSYTQKEKKRGRKLAMILYTLLKEGVSITNHSTDIIRLVKGQSFDFNTPFFVTSKEIANAHSRLLNSLGSKMFGAIVTNTRILLVYNPETKSQIFTQHENESIRTITSILRQAQPPYNEPSKIELLFMFRSKDDLIASFSGTGTQNGRNATTINFYEKLALKNSYIFLMGGNPYRLSEIFDVNYLKDVTATFCNHFKIKPQRVQGYDYLHVVGTCHEDGKEYVTYSLWTFSPTALVCALNYAANNKLGDNQKIMLMCYEKQIDWIKQILTAKQEYRNKFRVAFLHYQSMNDYINGITDFVE